MVFERFVTWLKTASDHERVLATKALAAAYLRSDLEGEEGEVADAVVTALLDDPDTEVRRTLAEALADHPQAPRHVIVGLAADIPDIATIVLTRSPLFFDGELIEMIAGGTPVQQIAIACRPCVSAAVSGAIAEVCEIEACIGLLANKGARVPAVALHRIAERFGDDAGMRRMLLKRAEIAPRTRVLLIELLGEAMAHEVVTDAKLSPGRIANIVRDNCDRALIASAARIGEDHLPEFVEAVIARSGMNAAFLLRAVCMGNISLFANGLARLAKVSLSRVETALADDRRTAFRALYRKSGLPEVAYGVFSSAITCWRNLLETSESGDLARLPYLVTREVLAAYDGQADPQLDQLLILLRKLAAEATRLKARREIDRLAEEPPQEIVLALPSPEAVEEPETIPTQQVQPTRENEIMEMPDEVIAEFAIHFAEEIVDLEEELAAATRGRLGGDELAAILSDEAIIAAIDFDGFDSPVMPDGAANDVAPAVHAVDATLPRPGRSERASVLVGTTRTHLRSRAAA